MPTPNPAPPRSVIDPFPRPSTPPHSRYSNASPASKMGSVAASHRIDDDGEEWQSAARRTLDVVSPGDQLPIPADGDDC